MEDALSIGEVAELLEIPAATIRFWEDAGLFSVTKKKNRYRTYTPRDLQVIADVMFLRNSGIPVKELSHLRQCSLEEHRRGQKELERELEKRLEQCRRMLARTRQQQDRLREVLRLQEGRLQPEEVPFARIARFDYREKEKLLQYSGDPSRYVRYYDTRDMSSEERGIIVPPDVDDGTVLWRRREGTRFLTFLIRERVERNYQSDVEKGLARIQKQHATGVLLAQYLFSAVENGEYTDFMKGYAEILT